VSYENLQQHNFITQISFSLLTRGVSSLSVGAGVLAALLGMGVGIGVVTGGSVTGGSVGIDMAFSVSPTKILSGRVASLRVVRRCTTSSCIYILQILDDIIVLVEEILYIIWIWLLCRKEEKRYKKMTIVIKDIDAHLGEYRRHL